MSGRKQGADAPRIRHREWHDPGKEVPRLRSGFQQQARTPSKRLNFAQARFHANARRFVSGQDPFDFAQGKLSALPIRREREQRTRRSDATTTKPDNSVTVAPLGALIQSPPFGTAEAMPFPVVVLSKGGCPTSPNLGRSGRKQGADARRITHRKSGEIGDRRNVPWFVRPGMRSPILGEVGVNRAMTRPG
jgi:hypothetical protein